VSKVYEGWIKNATSVKEGGGTGLGGKDCRGMYAGVINVKVGRSKHGGGR